MCLVLLKEVRPMMALGTITHSSSNVLLGLDCVYLCRNLGCWELISDTGLIPFWAKPKEMVGKPILLLDNNFKRGTIFSKQRPNKYEHTKKTFSDYCNFVLWLY